MSDRPETRKVLARDVVPYEWGLWCAIGNGAPFVNGIDMVEWSENGSELVFVLGTHNFYRARPDDELELVPMGPVLDEQWRADVRKRHAETIANRPTPTRKCETCGGAGKVPVTP